MDCENFLSRLDAYIDGELESTEEEQFVEHANRCEACARELSAAKVLRDMMTELDDSIDVPLKAQAAWRNAIRQEAAKRKKRVWLRAAYGLAAGLVLVAGCAFAFRNDLFKGNSQPLVLEMNEGTAASELDSQVSVAGGRARSASIIATDGDQMELPAATEDSMDESYTAWRKIETDSFDDCCDKIKALASEYSGELSSDKTESETHKRSVSYTIEMPYANMDDFLNAVSRVGNELDAETDATAVETAVIVLQIDEI